MTDQTTDQTTLLALTDLLGTLASSLTHPGRRLAALWAIDSLRRIADETPAAKAPWPTVTDFSIEVWEGDTWVGVTYKRKTLDEARERRDSFRRRFPGERFRIVRWDETSTVAEVDPEPGAEAQQDGAQR